MDGNDVLLSILKEKVDADILKEVREEFIKKELEGKIDVERAIDAAKAVVEAKKLIENYVSNLNYVRGVGRTLRGHKADDLESLRVIFGNDAEIFKEALNTDTSLKGGAIRLSKTGARTEVVDIDKLRAQFIDRYLNSDSPAWQGIRMMVEDGITQGEAAEAMGLNRVSDISNVLKRYWPILDFSRGPYSKDSVLTSHPLMGDTGEESPDRE